MIKRIIIILLFCFALQSTAQNKKDKVLLSIENENVYASEFLRVYNKNKDIVSDENKKDIEEYLDLFINYKLKLREAFDLKLDTVPSYVKEFNKYKEQLIEPFLKDRKVNDKLVHEAYDRTIEELNASHILIKLSAHASPKDTLEVYNKLMQARKEVLDGADFAAIAKKYSQDPSAKKNGGNLGFFNAFSMVYPFENAAYKTEVGQVSMPFKTNFGYHIVKVIEKRTSNGEVKVAHIMIKKDVKNPETAKNQIKDIYNKFKQGDTFEFLAKKYSDDKASAPKGGVLRKFSQSKMIQPFANISFSLKNINDVSEPFETKYGWHFVKLLKKYPIETFEELEKSLKERVEKGNRSVLIGNSIAKRLAEKYKVVVNKDVLDEVLNSTKENKLTSKTFLTFKDKVYISTDLKSYFENNKNLRKTYKDFINEKVIDYYKDNLENENEEYATTLKEYRDGLLLFDLLQNKIWAKAEKDTVGLKNFFDANKTDYKWKKRVKVQIASCTRNEKAVLVQKYLKEGKSIEKIKELVNEEPTIHVLFKEGTYEVSSNKLPSNFDSKLGVSNIIEEDEKHYTIVNVLEILPIAQKELKDNKGKVISDYQDYLEKEWIKTLRKNYKVTINKKTLKKLKKKYK